jgi:hypothetical protein
MNQSSRYVPSSGLTFEEWLASRQRNTLVSVQHKLESQSTMLAESLAQMAGIEPSLEASTMQTVQEALEILRQRDPLGGSWSAMAGEFFRLSDAGRSVPA